MMCEGVGWLVIGDWVRVDAGILGNFGGLGVGFVSFYIDDRKGSSIQQIYKRTVKTLKLKQFHTR